MRELFKELRLYRPLLRAFRSMVGELIRNPRQNTATLSEWSGDRHPAVYGGVAHREAGLITITISIDPLRLVD